MTDSLTYYISIASGALLTISEALPYISQVKGNSILQVLLNACSKFNEERKNEQDKVDALVKEIEELKHEIQALKTANNQTTG
jgi:hypothetical protein